MEELESLLLGHRESIIAGLALAATLGLAGWWLGPRLGWVRGWIAFSGVWLGLILGLAVMRSGLHVPSLTGNGAFWATCRRNPGLKVRSAQDLVNLAMVAPLAFSLTMASRRWWAGLLLSTGVIILVEVAQATLGTGICEAGDATRNLAGALAGAAAGWAVLQLVPRSRASRA
jgi:hypothetical protein